MSLLIGLSACLCCAQEPPCGRSRIIREGDKTENRFIAAPIDHVRGSAIRALPALAGRLTKAEERYIEAKFDGELFSATKNADFGSEGGPKVVRFGTFRINLSPAVENGVQGTQMQITYSTQGLSVWKARYAAPLADEVECLVRIQSREDPLKFPRGSAVPETAISQRQMALEAGMPVKLALRNAFFTKDVPKDIKAVDVVMEVLDDVLVDGAIVIRKGALANGRISEIAGSKSYGRRANFQFQVQFVTASDGQEIALSNNPVRRTGSSTATVAIVAALAPLGPKGNEGLIRAGTTWELPTASRAVIKVGQ